MTGNERAGGSWLDDEDTVPTLDGAALERLRAEGLFSEPRVGGWGAATDVGHVRRANEDAWAELDGRLFAVADGMGGHAGGALAARTAVTALLAAAGPGGAAGDALDLVAAVRSAGELVRRAGSEAGVRSLGTTLVVLLVEGGSARLLNVGDSRIYRLRDDDLVLLTRDHTIRNGLLDAGIDPDAGLEAGARLGALTSYLGAEADRLVVQVVSVALSGGDRYLLCTDGVHRQVPVEELQRLVGTGTCEQAAAALVARAAELGGRDNATAVVVELR